MCSAPGPCASPSPPPPVGKSCSQHPPICLLLLPQQDRPQPGHRGPRGRGRVEKTGSPTVPGTTRARRQEATSIELPDFFELFIDCIFCSSTVPKAQRGLRSNLRKHQGCQETVELLRPVSVSSWTFISCGHSRGPAGPTIQLNNTSCHACSRNIDQRWSWFLFYHAKVSSFNTADRITA